MNKQHMEIPEARGVVNGLAISLALWAVVLAAVVVAIV